MPPTRSAVATFNEQGGTTASRHQSFIDSALKGIRPCVLGLGSPRRVQTDDMVNRSYELLRAAEAEFFGE